VKTDVVKTLDVAGCSVFTASAWPAQVLSERAGGDREGLSASTRDDVEASHSGLSP